ncbi:hypothetical protein AN958_10663 [Leucoagaricus sp. SymC.cos]|nr:hypothetical protein AN958_10663 [Leucoagaricus sp. SymC.cos]
MNLRVIEIVVMELDSPFLARLHAPNLSILCIHFVDINGESVPPPNSVLPSRLQPLLMRSPSLQVLMLNALPFMELPVLLWSPEIQSVRIVEIIYSDVQQIYDFEKTLSEPRSHANSMSSQAIPPATAASTNRASKPSRLHRERKWEIKPLMDGALIVGWTDPELDKLFDHTLPMPWPVRMCGRTLEWWRVLRELEKQK